MIYLFLHLLKFWYPESLALFLRTWKHSILYLEESLAVFLMFKLLWIPLYRDSTIIGRVLSVIFRLLRILFGLYAFLVTSIFIFVLLAYWSTLPLLVLVSLFFTDLPILLVEVSRAVLLLGVGLFLAHSFTHPHQKIWEVKDGSFWQSSRIKKRDFNYQEILKSLSTQNLLTYLEISDDLFMDFSPIIDLNQLAEEAFNLAKKAGSQYLAAVHFFVAIVKNYPGIDNFLLKYNLKIEDFEETLFYLQEKSNKSRTVWIWEADFAIRHLKGVNRGWLGVPTHTFDLYAEDLTAKASHSAFQQFIGRKLQVAEVINILSQSVRRNVIITGPAGCGKTTLLEYLARLIVMGDAPNALAIKRLVRLDLTRLLSGIKSQGELADRINQIFKEVEFTQNVIIAVEEIHNLGLGEAGGEFNLYALMAPFLESDQFQFIGTTEPENYIKTVEKNSAFARLFTRIELPEATEKETIEILKDKSIEVAKKTRVKVTYIAIKEMVELASRLITERVLPDSAVAILEEAQAENKDGWITSQVVKEVVSHRVNIPVLEVGNLAKLELLNLEDSIHQRLIDQEEAVKAVADSLRRYSTGLREEDRPIGSFLFVGPTGVGKTELAKILAEIYFKNADNFLRFDMSEYQSASLVNRLIGSVEQSGQLTEAVRSKPYALILLDEFEKADPKILTLFLQILEDGRLTDGTGRLINFNNTIIIATSNAASLIIARGLESGLTLSQLDRQVNDELLQTFKPELINRFDDVVLFKPLSSEDLQKIVKLKLGELKLKLKKQGYLVGFEEVLVSELGKRGFDPVLGARPLRRLIQDTLEANLSKMILEERMKKGEVFKAGVELLR